MIKIKFIVKSKSTSPEGVAEGTVEVEFESRGLSVKNMSEHDLSALLFAAEFAINNKASEILGKSVRAHITEL